MKTWITDKEKCIGLTHIPSQHLVNILRKLRREAQARIALATTAVPEGTTWKDYVPVSFDVLDDEAAGRGLNWETEENGDNGSRRSDAGPAGGSSATGDAAGS